MHDLRAYFFRGCMLTRWRPPEIRHKHQRDRRRVEPLIDPYFVILLTKWLHIKTSQLTGTLICFIEFLSRNVTLQGSLWTESKSIVTPNGMPISSVLAYRRPIDPLESSTLWLMSSSFKAVAKEKKILGMFNSFLIASLGKKLEFRLNIEIRKLRIDILQTRKGHVKRDSKDLPWS